MELWYNGLPHSKKFRGQKSAWKVLALIFWDQDGILLHDYLLKGQTINVEYYSSLLVQLKDILKEKRRRKVTILHDNALAHQALATQKKLVDLGFPMSWSPTLFSVSGPVGLPPFPWTEKKKQLKGRHFSSDALLPRRPVWTDNLLNFCWVACKS